MLRKLSPYIFFLLVITSCGVFDKSRKKTTLNPPVIQLDTITIKATEDNIYRGTRTRKYDILHTALDVKFDFQKTFLYGKATLTIKPYFHPIDSLVLDAKNFDLHEVALRSGEDKKKLKYHYNNMEISIQLDKQYTLKDTFKIYIDYTAKPNEQKEGGSPAISSDKGLYFINPEGKEKGKPLQIWTQGETESNSCWFPTFDSPNERMTNEICMTVNDSLSTLSNGELYFQLHNADSTRTDCWKMNLPHAPYLVMMAVGKYSLVKDKWRDKEVNYYVEKKYEPYARAIFGTTPEMLEFYSNKLGVDYPWNKYSQIVVRDYISGAMENTTATVHGEFLQLTDRELLDNDHEDIIAHELFHQWFGDLVTCESWSNLPLNESFATYGEYLWFEHKYGRERAEDHLWDDRMRYLQEALQKQEHLIRFYYNDEGDMFDGHSYQKGGCILHMLRKYTGDEAFFAALKLYLERHKYSTVEIHQLRLAFEEITGEDLNWFFNQWFLSKGHPNLEIKYAYDADSSQQVVTVIQNQDLSSTSLFKLPVEVDIYVNGSVQRHNITISKKKEDFTFKVPAKPALVNLDAEKMLLCVKNEYKTMEEWAYQYQHAPLYSDRAEAIIALGQNKRDGNNIRYTSDISELYADNEAGIVPDPLDSLAQATLLNALNDKYYAIKLIAIEMLGKDNSSSFKNKLIELAEKDSNSLVRANSIGVLSKQFPTDELLPLLKNRMNDRSYMVLSQALLALTKLDKKEALIQAAQLEKEENVNLLISIASVYAVNGTEANHDFFVRLFDKSKGWNKVSAINLYGGFLERSNDETINKGIKILEQLEKSTASKWEKFYVQKVFGDLISMYSEREIVLLKRINDLKGENSNDTTIQKLQRDLEPIQAQKQKITSMYNFLTE